MTLDAAAVPSREDQDAEQAAASGLLDLPDEILVHIISCSSLRHIHTELPVKLWAQ